MQLLVFDHAYRLPVSQPPMHGDDCHPGRGRPTWQRAFASVAGQQIGRVKLDAADAPSRPDR
jgi:hypothetical protein